MSARRMKLEPSSEDELLAAVAEDAVVAAHTFE
jgi:hypothetical protein